MDLSNRLQSVIKKDKEKDPKYLIDVIKSDVYYLINNYFEVDFGNIDIDIALEDDSYKISIICNGERIKQMNFLPE